MKRTMIYFAMMLFFASCAKDSSLANVQHEEIVGLSYSGSGYEVEIKSATSLEWRLSDNRGSEMSYTVDYKFESNNIQFFITTELSDGSYTTELNDSFYGYFNGVGVLVGDKVIHNYAIYKGDIFFESSGSSERRGITLRKQ